MKKVIVMGCPRSGTHYTTELLRHHGLDVKHEQMGPDGSVSFFFGSRRATEEYDQGRCLGVWDFIDTGVPSSSPYGPFLHQVRDPIRTMSSITALQAFATGAIPRYCEQCSGRGLLTDLMEFWIEWNMRCEDLCEYTFRVEGLSDPIDHTVLREVCDLIGIKIQTAMLQHVPTNENTLSGRPGKSYKNITRELLMEADRGLADELFKLAERYGY